MRLFSISVATALSFISCSIDDHSKANLQKAREMNQKVEGFYDLKAETIDGEQFDFSSLKGKRVLIVNTASKCGYTSQYEGLQALYEKYAGEDFTIIGFPSNDFGSQEPGSNEDIVEFCTKNYGVTFTLMAKAPVKGENQQPVYQWLTKKDFNGVDDAKVSWNFNKFLVDENGKWVSHFGSGTKPLDEKITSFVSGS